MSFRFALSKYITHPENYPHDIIYYNEEVIILKDLFPKSKVHLLVMPRDAELSKQTPQQAFSNARNIEWIKPYLEMGKDLAIKEFNKNWKGKTVGDGDDVELIVCCHSVPSLNNLHIHILTDDLSSPCMKNRKHYNSFKTKFAIKFNEFPLPGDDVRTDQLLKQDLVYNGVNYKNQFKEMKEVIDHYFNKKYIKL